MGSLGHLSSQTFPSLVCARFLASGWVSASDALNCGTAGFLGSCCLVWGICNVDFGACGFVFRPHLSVLGSAPDEPQWSIFYSVSRRMDFMRFAGGFSPSASVGFPMNVDQLVGQESCLNPHRICWTIRKLSLGLPGRCWQRLAGFCTLLTTLKKSFRVFGQTGYPLISVRHFFNTDKGVELYIACFFGVSCAK